MNATRLRTTLVGWVSRMQLTHPTAILLCVFAGLAHAAPVKDDAGHTLDLARPAQRVISLAPSLTEMLYAVGGGDTLVGAVEYSDYPPAARAVPRIGSNQKLDLERIATLKPDLVLVWYHGNAQREVATLAALGIPMFYLEPKTIADIPGAMQRIGQLLGRAAQADAAAQAFRTRHATLRARYAQRPPLRVFYQIAERPLLTINDQQIISDVLRLCGGINVFGQERMLVPQLSNESVVAKNPDVMFATRLGDDPTPLRQPEEASFATWRRFPNLQAVRSGQQWLISGDLISRHGPRILDAAESVCTALDEARKAR